MTFHLIIDLSHAFEGDNIRIFSVSWVLFPLAYDSREAMHLLFKILVNYPVLARYNDTFLTIEIFSTFG